MAKESSKTVVPGTAVYNAYIAILLRGFRFGMLLQLAIGPVCIFIFQIAATQGFYLALLGILGATLVDSLFILAAVAGIAAVIEKKNIKLALKIGGGAILFFFGLSTVLAQLKGGFLPTLYLENSSAPNNVFFHTLLLTISNPLTILFWAGVFSAKVTEENMKQKDIYIFGIGSLLSTLFFLILIALVGSLSKAFFTDFMIQGLNLIVGLLLIYFSMKVIFKKQ